jgi:hypothetical protein
LQDVTSQLSPQAACSGSSIARLQFLETHDRSGPDLEEIEPALSLQNVGTSLPFERYVQVRQRFYPIALPFHSHHRILTPMWPASNTWQKKGIGWQVPASSGREGDMSFGRGSRDSNVIDVLYGRDSTRQFLTAFVGVRLSV